MALRFSKKIGSPGIVVAPEAYNNYGVYNTKNLEKLMQQPSDIIQARLKNSCKQLLSQFNVNINNMLIAAMALAGNHIVVTLSIHLPESIT